MRYRAHGLTIASNHRLLGLVPARESALPDLIVQFGAEQPSSAARAPWFERRYQPGNGPPDLVASRLDDGRWLEFAYADGTTFVVSGDTSTVAVTKPAAFTIDDVAEYLLGPILGIILRLRGALVLHASAVAIDGRAVAFAGAAGTGKSTLAAAFARRGRPVLADDTIALARRDARWFASPAFPRLRLWPEAVSALGWDAGSPTTAVTDVNPRCQIDLQSAARFLDEPVALAAIYLIGYETTLTQARIDRVAAASALPLLAAHTFASQVLSQERREQEFHDLADLVADVPVRRLMRAPDLLALDRTCQAIVDDVDV